MYVGTQQACMYVGMYQHYGCMYVVLAAYVFATTRFRTYIQMGCRCI